MEGKVLEKVQEEKDLGVMVHKAMNGSRQVTEAVKKANRALAQLRRTITNKEIDTVIRNTNLQGNSKTTSGVQRTSMGPIFEEGHKRTWEGPASCYEDDNNIEKVAV